MFNNIKCKKSKENHLFLLVVIFRGTRLDGGGRSVGQRRGRSGELHQRHSIHFVVSSLEGAHVQTGVGVGVIDRGHLDPVRRPVQRRFPSLTEDDDVAVLLGEWALFD